MGVAIRPMKILPSHTGLVLGVGATALWIVKPVMGLEKLKMNEGGIIMKG